ncbi:RNA methyltransferase [Lichenihabitans psoromatis]|uniref:RNA methyltransferase n=1 Tax=Lichenihabitans psoromatis TaxID=2528642 RepID=UPI001038557A|nr:RNA methyltransferase [Lichenihabitans psoromatis]
MVGAGTDRTKPMVEGGPAIILVRPQLAVNIGTAARAMANFGLSDLRLVAPRAGWPPAEEYRAMAEAAAAGATPLLDQAKLYDTVQDAVADLNCLWATTARERGQGKRLVEPDIAMAEVADGHINRQERHGILFGPERTGLNNDEVALADVIVTFPVSPTYGSLNLAQAVLLMGYEWRKAQDRPAPAAPIERSPRAPRDQVIAFFNYLETELTEAGYFRPDDKQPVMRRNLRNILHRLAMTEQDVRTLRGAVVRLVSGRRVDTPRTIKRASGADPE